MTTYPQISGIFFELQILRNIPTYRVHPACVNSWVPLFAQEKGVAGCTWKTSQDQIKVYKTARNYRSCVFYMLITWGLEGLRKSEHHSFHWAKTLKISAQHHCHEAPCLSNASESPHGTWGFVGLGSNKSIETEQGTCKSSHLSERFQFLELMLRTFLKPNSRNLWTWYCWWKKSCTTWHVWHPANKGYIPYQLVSRIFSINSSIPRRLFQNFKHCSGSGRLIFHKGHRCLRKRVETKNCCDF